MVVPVAVAVVVTVVGPGRGRDRRGRSESLESFRLLARKRDGLGLDVDPDDLFGGRVGRVPTPIAGRRCGDQRADKNCGEGAEPDPANLLRSQPRLAAGGPGRGGLRSSRWRGLLALTYGEC